MLLINFRDAVDASVLTAATQHKERSSSMPTVSRETVVRILTIIGTPFAAGFKGEHR